MGRTCIRSTAVLLLLALAVSVFCSQAAASQTAAGRAVFRKEPYLIFPGAMDEIQVLWQMQTTASCTLDWGTDTTYSLGSAVTAEYGTEHQHTHTLTGLTAGGHYFYRVRSGVSRTGSFRAAPLPDATRLKFLAYGDTRSYPADYNAVAAQMLTTLQADADYQTIALLAGDLVNNGDLEADWDGQFFPTAYSDINELHANVPTQAARGNHERAAILYGKYFPYPYAMGLAWSFDYGPAHFVVVDQYIDYGPGSAQLQWIESDLATSRKPWKFLCYHEPGWSAGGGHENEIPVQDYLHPLCVQYGVQIAFAGHNHYYARAVVDGVHHVTTGGGGAPLRTPDPSYPYIVTAAEAYHFCKIEIDGDQLIYEVIAHDGTLLDTFAMEHATDAPEWEATPAAIRSNAPNPFSGGTTVRYFVPRAGHVGVRVYDVSGRFVATVVDEWREPGEHTAVWDGLDRNGQDCGSGVYFLNLESNGSLASRKVVLAR
jgi:hypothetical protein